MPHNLPIYLHIKLDRLFEDVSANAKRKGLETAFAYELFELESQIAEAKVRGDEKLAKTILDQNPLRRRVTTSPAKKTAGKGTPLRYTRNG